MKKALYIEDDEVYANLVSHMLKDGNITCSVSPSIKDAERLAKSDYQPHVLLVDLVLPGYTERESLRLAVNLWKGVPVVLMTAHDDDILSKALKESGATIGAFAAFNKGDLTDSTGRRIFVRTVGLLADVGECENTRSGIALGLSGRRLKDTTERYKK